MTKTTGAILRALATLCIWSAGWYLLYRYEYFTAFTEIDDVVGMLPVVLIMVCAGGMTWLIWSKRNKELAPVSAVVALLAVLSALLFPTALRGNWWIGMSVLDESEAKPDLSVYLPFSEDSLTAKLSGPSDLTLNGELPVLDGATALYPVYAAFAEAVYDKTAFSQTDVLCTNTVGAYKALIAGERDIIFVAGASEKQMSAAKEAGADLRFTPIGREAFVFLVGKSNPVENLSVQQIRNIYSGKTAHWKTLGWSGGGRIIAFQRPEGSGSQTGLQNIMGSLPIQAPQPLPDASLIGSNSLINQISAEWKGVQPVIGYSYRFFAAKMYPNPDAKMLSVNGAEPSPENIRGGSYPFTADFYAVTNGEPKGNVKLLIEWILSEQGQELIEKTGYTPYRNEVHE